jgi:hypothetical protein
MTIAALTNISRRELAHRVSGGLEITLYWNADENSTSVQVYHSTTEETITFSVAPDQALDGFHHPFAHLAAQRHIFQSMSMYADDEVLVLADPGPDGRES